MLPQEMCHLVTLYDNNENKSVKSFKKTKSKP